MIGGNIYARAFQNWFYITAIEDLKDFITVIFVIVNDIYQEVIPAYIKNGINSNDPIMSADLRTVKKET